MMSKSRIFLAVALGILTAGAEADDLPARAALYAAAGNASDLFPHRGDVGAVRTPGTMQFEPRWQSYELAGSGTNMWADHDEFYFVWRKFDGEFILSADVTFLDDDGDPHRKAGWMIRSSLDPDAAYVDAAVHADGLASLQYRPQDGAATEERKSPVSAPRHVQLERRGDQYILAVAREGEIPTRTVLDGVHLPGEVLVGLFVCAHDADAVARARFDNVRLSVPAPAEFRPYQDYYPSRLEILDVASDRRRVVHTTPDSMQAPNWLPDGRTLLFNRNGLLYRYDLENETVSRLDTGFADRNNNDHAVSFDGRRLGISHHSADHDGVSIVYTLPIDGGEPQLVTPTGPSYLHGWSPDGDWLVYTGGRDDNYDIYRMRANGQGGEVRLTADPALDDGAEYAPDGRHIYFNSARSGRMEIWRMRPDGTESEQLTNDEYNNWFPHVSPDGQRLVYLAYPPDVAPDDHPWYRQVRLVLKDLDNGASRTLAHLYGGQGTINVPSWSPDGKFIAFVSN